MAGYGYYDVKNFEIIDKEYLVLAAYF